MSIQFFENKAKNNVFKNKNPQKTTLIFTSVAENQSEICLELKRLLNAVIMQEFSLCVQTL